MSKPWDCSSLMAAMSWGIEALMFGSLMMLASGVWARSPNWVRKSGMRCCSVRLSGKFARMRPASEMSRVSTATPVPLVKAWMMGSREYVARAGASSISVQMIVCGVMISPLVRASPGVEQPADGACP